MLFVLGKNDRYLILTAQLYDAREMAADAKTKGDKAAQRTAQDRIRVIQQGDGAVRSKAGGRLLLWLTENLYCFPEMKPLEAHPVFNPAIKVSDAPQKEKKVPAVSEDKEDLSFKLFEQAERKAAPEKGWNRQDGDIPEQQMPLLIVMTNCLHM